MKRRNRGELSQAVIEGCSTLLSLSPHLVEWVSPLEKNNFAEYQETAFLKACGCEHMVGALNEFWPNGGPVWDALAVADLNNGQEGIILVEAKSHPPEIHGGGMKARAWKSREKIEKALHQTKAWLGVSPDAAWTGRLYQSANRLAHLYLFRQVMNIPAWLVNIYFINDPHSPTEHSEWVKALKEIKSELGISRLNIPFMAEFIPDEEWTLEYFVRSLSFENGRLISSSDYVSGRHMKTDIIFEPGGRVTLETRNRGKGADRWILHLQGKKHIQPVKNAP